MKNIMFSILALLFFFSPLAFAGGSSDGTGSLVSANEKDIRDGLIKGLLQLQIITLDFAMPSPFTGKVDFGKIVPPEVQFIFGQDYEMAIMTFQTAADEPSSPSIEFRKTGLCPGPDGATGEGSIVTVSGKPRLCLALSRLENIPRDSIDHEMTVLLAHELSHVVGKGETTARQAQDFISRYTAVREDLARFVSTFEPHTIGPGMRFEMLINALTQADPKSLCDTKNWGDVAADVDQSVRSLRYKMSSFPVEFRDVNQKEYWVRREANVIQVACATASSNDDIRAAVKKLQDDYRSFYGQFGWLMPREAYGE